MIILGLDPGTARTGYGIVRKTKPLKCLGYGVIQTSPLLSAANRLKLLNNQLSKIIKDYRPHIVVVENVYFFKNLKTVIPVSQAKGVILLTVAKKNLPIYELTPLQVKLALTGYGWSEKKIVQKKVKNILNLGEELKSDDAADALAVAIAHCFNKRIKKT